MILISDIHKTNSSYGNYAITVIESITDYRGYVRDVQATKFFFKKKDAQQFIIDNLAVV